MSEALRSSSSPDSVIMLTLSCCGDNAISPLPIQNNHLSVNAIYCIAANVYFFRSVAWDAPVANLKALHTAVHIALNEEGKVKQCCSAEDAVTVRCPGALARQSN